MGPVRCLLTLRLPCAHPLTARNRMLCAPLPRRLRPELAVLRNTLRRSRATQITNALRWSCAASLRNSLRPTSGPLPPSCPRPLAWHSRPLAPAMRAADSHAPPHAARSRGVSVSSRHRSCSTSYRTGSDQGTRTERRPLEGLASARAHGFAMISAQGSPSIGRRGDMVTRGSGDKREESRGGDAGRQEARR